jgi:hypothetical protein
MMKRNKSKLNTHDGIGNLDSFLIKKEVLTINNNSLKGQDSL